MLESNKTLKKIAITGGVSCGKSTVCQIFKGLGAYVVSADEIVHDILLNNQKIIEKVVKLLGVDILINNRIDRAIIAKKVFNQPIYLESLEAILHPVVQQEINKQYELKKREGLSSLFIAEIPLLFEAKCESQYDTIIAVIADEKQCRDRFEKMNKFQSTEFEKRQIRQLSNQEKSKNADYVITNNGSLEDLRNKVKQLCKIL